VITPYQGIVSKLCNKNVSVSYTFMSSETLHHPGFFWTSGRWRRKNYDPFAAPVTVLTFQKYWAST